VKITLRNDDNRSLQGSREQDVIAFYGKLGPRFFYFPSDPEHTPES